VGGEVSVAGNREIAAKLARALDVAPPSMTGTDEADRDHVHGFHAYPARLHPTTAARLIEALASDRATILDPFCGSGTLLVEAMVAGRRAVGTDLNPLAVRLTRLKTARHDPRDLDAIVRAARAIATIADERRTRRAGATHRFPPDDVALFDPHVLLELDSIRAGILQEARDMPKVREALELVLSAILIKVSRQAADSSTAQVKKRIMPGFPARTFASKAEELVRRLAQFVEKLPPGALPALVALDDALRLKTVPASSVDVVITSPPYAATHDYVAHHAARMRWLGLDGRTFEAHEMGSRRRYAGLPANEVRAEWSRELARMLKALARACRPGGKLALILGDSAVHGEALRADEIVASVAPSCALVLVARASQRRPHFHAPSAPAFERTPRCEHVMVLSKR
jgi:SAM-dependent methyltransferase